jgi:phosphotransferase family enzyme
MKLQWEDLPDEARAAVEAQCGPVLKAEAAAQGLMPGVAARLHAADGGRAFVKAVAVDSPASRLYLHERNANRALTSAVPAPRMIWSAEVAGWVVMVFESISGRNVDLSPGSPDIPSVLETVAWLGDALTPCPWADAPPVGCNVEALQDKAAALLTKPPGVAPDRAMYAAALEGLDMGALAGDTLLHYDLHGGNLQMVGGEIRLIDWSFAAVGAAWIDAVMLAPRFIEAGHTPQQAEALMSDLPAWHTAPSAAVTGLAALWTAFRDYKARYGPEPLRPARARAAAAGKAWIQYRTGQQLLV